MHPDYFEGTLQLRNPTQEIVDFVENSGAQISKVEELKNGLDLYFVSQRALRSLGKDLGRRFSGELKTSNRLFTRNRLTGKEVYRVTVLFRCYNLRKGGIVAVRGISYKVLAVGKKVYLQNEKTGEKKWFSYGQLPSQLRES